MDFGSGGFEAEFWRRSGAAWQQLCGNLLHSGYSLEAHDLYPKTDVEWSRSFHPESIELCLNLSGEGTIGCRDRVLSFKSATAFYYRIGREPVAARRLRGQRHRFLTLELRREHLLRLIADCDEGLETPLREGLMRRDAPSGIWEIGSIDRVQSDSLAKLWQPPVAAAARVLWYRAKVSELIAEYLFPPVEELFCVRQKRIARERVALALGALGQDLANPPSLAALARIVGVSAFHLSRTFSREMGVSIPRYLRQRRMERAAALLRAGTHNVTEAAFEVGYSSLGNFSRAFAEEMGCAPGSYPPRTGEAD